MPCTHWKVGYVSVYLLKLYIEHQYKRCWKHFYMFIFWFWMKRRWSSLRDLTDWIKCHLIFHHFGPEKVTKVYNKYNQNLIDVFIALIHKITVFVPDCKPSDILYWYFIACHNIFSCQYQWHEKKTETKWSGLVYREKENTVLQENTELVPFNGCW